MTYAERVTAAMSRRSYPERRRILRAIEPLNRAMIPCHIATRAVAETVLAGDRTLRKREQDAASDGRRRKLVGARVPLDLYCKCKAAADIRGISLYAWVVEALEEKERRGIH